MHLYESVCLVPLYSAEDQAHLNLTAIAICTPMSQWLETISELINKIDHDLQIRSEPWQLHIHLVTSAIFVLITIKLQNNESHKIER